jgi:hypothetical protein
MSSPFFRAPCSAKERVSFNFTAGDETREEREIRSGPTRQLQRVAHPRVPFVGRHRPFCRYGLILRGRAVPTRPHAREKPSVNLPSVLWGPVPVARAEVRQGGVRAAPGKPSRFGLGSDRDTAR